MAGDLIQFLVRQIHIVHLDSGALELLAFPQIIGSCFYTILLYINALTFQYPILLSYRKVR